MKAFKELKLEDLTVEQKIGMTMCGHAFEYWDEKYENNILMQDSIILY